MNSPEIVLIAAVASNGAIGKDNALPWRLKADLAHFKAATLGHPIVMGRKTWESLGRPLPGRTNIVISRDRNYAAPGALVVNSLAAAVAACADHEQLFVIGGAQIYALALPLADRLLLTEVDASIEGDAFFPTVDRAAFEETERRHQPRDADNDHAADFVDYRRVN
ncbi:MAG TPA: dihydrofolate reductase [Denitromonas sp.]|uniref:dihydrofolate reductase n=1 Tax=Denitromonas sp. TaxID=2734609 RepID=UPI001E1703C1|nr:dihydrofolate reductase [Rhodocyclaceae bacterium]MCP5221730.1 dihydrofolate reductase [Zoogloeaceae bacterium]HPR07562.1 dihydrofolate reductase [Denitromonas sp.]HQU87956.1 dihydrofolate reductase [Denitromonas sp.]HQV14616.1 dihydrofolate reductase [Denitromonas sp.]